MTGFIQDLRFAIRSIRKNPGFAVVVIGTMALAIGATTAIYSLASATLTKSLPYREPSRLVHLWDATPTGRHQASFPDYEDWRARNHVFAGMGAYVGDYRGILKLKNDQVSVRAAGATAGFFPTLGVTPILGRSFEASDSRPGAEKTVLMSWRLWSGRFGADPGVLGRTVVLNGSDRRIVGILPKGFNFAPALGADLWVPLRIEGEMRERRNLWWLNVVARLEPGVSLGRARSEMRAIARQLEAEHPDSNGRLGVDLVPLRDQILGPIRPVLRTLLGAVAAVLLIACANLAGLLLSRASSRQKDIAVRSSLGARAGAIARQFLAESLLLGLLGGVLGLLAARMILDLLLTGLPDSQIAAMPYLRLAGLDPGVLAAGFGVCLLASAAIGLVPAFAARTPPARVLREGLGDRDRSRARDGLVVAEIVLAVVLLAAAGLMLRSTIALLHVDAGFDRKNLLTLQVAADDRKYSSPERLATLHDELLSRVRSVPGVAAAGTVDVLPLSGGNNTVLFAVEGRPAPEPGHENEANIRSISPRYFAEMKIPFLAGRPFDRHASPNSPKTVIINRLLAKRFFRTEDPIGKRLRFTFDAKQPYREIVGVVGDENQVRLDADPTPVIYTNYFQSPDSAMSVVVRTTGEPERLGPAVKKAIHELDPDLLVFDVASMSRLVEDSPSTFLRRYPAFLIGAFAAAALLLAALGLYGIMAYSVSRRTRELGVRLALGAQPRDIRRLVLSEGARIIGIGLVFGCAAALAATRLLSSLLFGVHATDPATAAFTAAVLAFAGLLACYLPARRAARVDPIEALRAE